MNIDATNRQNLYNTSQIMPPKYNVYTIPTVTRNQVQTIQTGSTGAGTGRGGICGKIACIVICIIALVLIVAAAVTAVVVGILVSKSSSSDTSTETTIEDTASNVTTTTKVNSYTSWLNTKCDYGYVYNGNGCDECGVSDLVPNVRIVGGQPAVPYSWPAQVLVIFTYKFDFSSTKPEYSFICGGTLISRYTVLTAAHCVPATIDHQVGTTTYKIPVVPNKYYTSAASMFKIYLGISDVSFLNKGTKPTSPGIEATVLKVIKHPSYNADTDVNDIALFILTSPITPNKYMKLACLPYQKSNSYPNPNQNCWAAGWGTLSSGGSRPSVLYNIKLNVYDFSKCIFYPNLVPNTQVCAGELAGGKDTCQGDSGGGLYTLSLESDKERYVVSGVVSYGDGCAQKNKPGIYSRTSYFLDWITSNWKTA